MASGDLKLPPGFRFHPTDEELVMHYLLQRCAGKTVSAPIIAEIDLYKFDPWQLPGMALYGEKEWYFFSPRDRKYPKGSRPNRAAGNGYWKATGADKPVGSPKPVAIKKSLVFYSGKAPNGAKTNWIMHEYRLADVDRSARKKKGLRLDDWVLCRIYNKKGAAEKPVKTAAPERKPAAAELKVAEIELSQYLLIESFKPPPGHTAEMWCFDAGQRLPQLQQAAEEHSSCSDPVLSSPELAAGEWEVDSEPMWEGCLVPDDGFLDYVDATGRFPPMSPMFQDVLNEYMYLS